MDIIRHMKKLISLLICLIFSTSCFAGIPGAVYQPTAGVNTVGTLPINCGGLGLTGIGGAGTIPIGTSSGGYQSSPITSGNGINVSGESGQITITAVLNPQTVSSSFNAFLGHFYSVSVSGAIVCTLPTAIYVSGQQFTVDVTAYSSGSITFATTSSQTINGLSASSIKALSSVNSFYTFISDGSNWQILNTNNFYNTDTTLSITPDDGSVLFNINQGSLSLSSIGGSLNLASQVGSTVLPIANGGTNASSLAGYGAVVMNSGGTAQTVVAPGSNNNVLLSNGTSWTSGSAPAPSLVAIANGGTGQTTQQAAINALAGSATAGQVLVYNGTNWVPAAAVSNYFGTGADGAVTISSSTNLTSTTDGPAVIKNYSSLTVNSGQILSVSNRCQGLIIYVTGNCTINGSLMMDGLGASASGLAQNIYEYIGQTDGITFGQGPLAQGTYATLAVGASGATATTTTAPNGTVGSPGQSGGGGAGGYAYANTNAGGNGTAGTSFSGGSGGGGAAYTVTGGNATTNGGAGGTGANSARLGTDGGGGGGGGNPVGSGGTGNSGTAHAGNPGVAGGGGYLVLIVGGNLTIGASGVISANGGAGGTGGACTGGAGGAGGGGAGGGVVWVFYQGTLSNAGTITATGGTGGATGTGAVPSFAGGNGGAGSTAINKII